MVAIDGATGWVTPTGAETLAAAPAATGTILLAGFDPYVLAPISHRPAIIPDGHVDDVSRAAGWISAVVLVDGVVAGTWTAEQTQEGTTIDVNPFAPLSSEIAAELVERADALGERLLPEPVTVRIADIRR
jgi:hypothetical protein